VKFGTDFVEQMDGRSAFGKEVRRRMNALMRDLGGEDSLSFQQQSWSRGRFGLIWFYRMRNVGLPGARVSTSARTPSSSTPWSDFTKRSGSSARRVRPSSPTICNGLEMRVGTQSDPGCSSNQ
jgi:hypothetical protein